MFLFAYKSCTISPTAMICAFAFTSNALFFNPYIHLLQLQAVLRIAKA
jgi:hypothetical protein